MDGRHLPGFYFDEEKKKYFRIQPNSAAAVGAKYTKSYVEKQKAENKKRKRHEWLGKKQETERVRLNQVLNSSIVPATLLSGETGRLSTEQLTSKRMETYFGSLEPFVCSYSSTLDSEISCFDYDVTTRGLVVGHRERSAYRLDWISTGQTRIPHLKNAREHLHCSASDISSVSISGNRAVVSTALGSSGGASLHVTSLLDPSETGSDDVAVASAAAEHFHPPMHMQMTVFTSTLGYDKNAVLDTIAVGTSEGIMMFHYDGRGGHDYYDWHDAKSDVLSLAWLAPTTLAAGLRNAGVVLWDIRSQGSSVRLQHGGTVTGLRRGSSPSQIVACGMNNALSVYDLRYTKQQPPRKPKAKRTTRPLLALDYNNDKGHYPIGFDVFESPQTPVIAAAEGDGTVQTYSLRTGKKIRRFAQEWPMSHVNEWTPESTGNVIAPSMVRCIKCVEDERGKPIMLFSAGRKVIQASWDTEWE